MLIYPFSLHEDSTSCPPPSCSPTSYTLLLGGFDGLHLGHRRLLSEAKKVGLPLAATTMFGGKWKELFTKEERRTVFEQAGISYLLELDLTEACMALSAEEFLRSLFALVPAAHVFCGEDFRFGKDALGTPELLKKFAPCPVTVQKTVEYPAEGKEMRKFSTSDCKNLLKAGQLARLNACLVSSKDDFFGGAYFIQGTVEHGREVGRTYGFPTLNLSAPAEKLLPPDGVYGGMCATPMGDFPTIVNIGARPTFGALERKIEAYLDGFSGDLYGATVEIYPTEFFRGIEKFPSADALKVQLQRDITRLRTRRSF